MDSADRSESQTTIIISWEMESQDELFTKMFKIHEKNSFKKEEFLQVAPPRLLQNENEEAIDKITRNSSCPRDTMIEK